MVVTMIVLGDAFVGAFIGFAIAENTSSLPIALAGAIVPAVAIMYFTGQIQLSAIWVIGYIVGYAIGYFFRR